MFPQRRRGWLGFRTDDASAAALGRRWKSGSYATGLGFVIAAATLAAQPTPSAAPGATYTETIPGSKVSFEMVAVPGGTFTMGSPASEAGREADEGPQVEVTLKPFWIGKTEVTWDEYDQFAFVGNTGARTGDGGAGDSDAVSKPSRAYGDEAKGYGKGKMPALAMTQHAAMEYCRWLSSVTGKAYRLPTEAEWEYAARAGETGARPASLDEQAWHSGNAKDTPHLVGTKKPNGFGLYDMLGNVAEWTFDLYAANRYAEWAPKATQPVALPTDKRYPHPTRGGSFIEAADKLRYANRQSSHEDWSQRDPQVPQSIYWHTDADHVGFRVARALDEQANLKGFKSKVIKESADR
jgi:formylglycine-generating enzyme required for sulfatase activity